MHTELVHTESGLPTAILCKQILRLILVSTGNAFAVAIDHDVLSGTAQQEELLKATTHSTSSG